MDEFTRFILTSMMFVRSANGTTEDSIPYTLVPSVRNAVSSTNNWFANPDRALFFSYDEGILTNMDDDDPPRLRQGDIIWFSFAMQYTIGSNNWAPDYRLIEVVRVNRIPEGLLQGPRFSAFEPVPSNIRRPLRAGKVTVLANGT